ncbi:MAG: DUF423 domain-containing protein [Luteibacter sp.]|uniref:DUF423 domain-containing protein n=1 Tax=unclassified Luteibacter TaxID=2620188 RepID=UPI002807F08D|nr:MULTISPECIES: DUF423 domain-containing protein [unclassified Luteibacter]MDQ7997184.1 DUF423 domain-containing protein [Luteibacter sp.]MDQ8049922.1 DUF423 domain-containing protein [Luteibacter sp.]MDR6644630.1 uncharacterized membrane protein YgdD (TMEM256/DUF423 family) [Luteibacter sp. 1214]
MRQPVSGAHALLVGVAGASAVGLGAFGAHALRGVVDDAGLQVWHTAVQYHFWHALAMFVAVVGLAPGRARSVAVALFAVGIVLFSGSLYALALGAPRWTGAMTPFGGVAFIVAWIAVGLSLRRAP